MQVLIIQHVAFEGPGSIAAWLQRRGVVPSYRMLHDAAARLPDPAGFDLIVLMGGPMSVNDEAEHPWLVEEKRFLRAAIAAGAAVVGICLGAQLIASALGAPVRAGPEKEIGWFDIEAVAAGADALAVPGRMRVFHWHGETFELPAGAVWLARSALTPHQAFQIGRRVVGLQFHPETTPETLESLIAHAGHELVEAVGAPSAAVLRAATAADFARGQAFMDAVLDYVSAR